MLCGLWMMTIASLKGLSQFPTIRSSSFASPINIGTGLYPNGIVMADFDGDGKADLATPGNYSISGQKSSVSVLRNVGSTGTPAFAAALNLTAGQFTNSLATGDINGDGKADLVSASVTDQTFSVFLNTSVSGAIHFADKADFALGQAPTYLAVADLDGDGKPDVVVVNNLAGTISVFRNTSAGGSVSFSARVDYAVGIFPSCVAIGDLDGDGKPDLAVVNNTSNTVSLFRNNSNIGTIALAAKVDLATAAGTDDPFGIALVDLDGDGKSDLVVTNNNVNNITPAVVAFSIFRNASTVGNFSFAAALNFSTGNAYRIASGDLNGDGKPDLVIATASGDANVTIYQNKSVAGSISLGAPALEYSLSAFATAVGDLDGDGLPDLAVANFTGSTVWVYRNKIYEPAITAVNPSTAAGGAAVTLKGANFTGATSVLFGGIPAASYTIVSDTVITAVVGTGAGGNVTVTGPKGTGIYQGFIFAGPPVITSFLPTSAAAGTTVTITGFNFDYLEGVSFGGVQAVSYTLVSSDTVTAVVGQGGSGNAFLVTSYGNASAPGFTYLPLPVISGFSPVVAGAGTPVMISGQNFTGATAVSFGGVAATSFTVVNSTTIQATPGTGASGDVGVTTGYGVADLAGFTWQAAPTLSGFSPTGGAYGTVITITGSNFENITGVSIGGINYTGNFVLISPTTIQVTLDGAASSGDIVITTAGGTVSLPGFVYYNVPVPNYIIPATGGPGMTVTITGMNFDGTQSVTLGGVPVKSFSVVSNDTIVAIVGSGASGSVVVTNPAGSNFEAPSFTFTTAPQIFSYTPDSGVVGSLVTITGGNFSSDDVVYFGGGVAVPKSLTASQIVVAVPASATFAPVAVVSPAHRQAGYIDQPFSLTFPNGVSAFTQASFAGHMEFRTGTKPSDIAVGDIDGDGKADVAVVNFTDGTVSVFRNIGGPGKIVLAPKLDLQVGYGSKNIALADVNGDGKLDIVVSKGNDDNCGGCGGTGIVILRNISQPGSLAFASAVTVPSARQLDFMVVGDLDGDGKPDIAGANETFVISGNGPYGNSAALFIFRNVSSGDSIGFEEFDESVTVQSYISGVLVNGMALRDVNQDGKPDIILGESPGDFIVVLTNKAFPGFMNFTTNFVGRDATEDSYGQFPLPADFYLDGRPDLAATGSYFGNMFNTQFSVAYFQSPTGPGAAADLNGDGRPDLVRARTEYEDSVISIMKDTAIIPVPLVAGVGYPALYATRRIVVGDLDGDGKPEIIVTNHELNSLSIFRNRIGEPALPAPVVSGFSPTTGGYSTLLTITGSNFDQATSVNVGGVPVLSYNVISSTTIMAVVDTGASGKVSIATPGGADSLGGFTYIASILPKINSLVPSTAIAGTPIVISGINFTDVSAVKFGGVAAASFSVVSPNSIIAIVDTSASDTVTVTTAAGSVSIGGFTFVGTPHILMKGPNPVCAGQVLKLVASPTDSAAEYQWYNGSVVVGSGNGDTLVVGSAGTYSVTTTINEVTSPRAEGLAVTMGATLSAPVITQSGDSLLSSAMEGNQWYMDTTTELMSDTGQVFRPGVTGSYAVRYMLNGCPSPFSAVYAFMSLKDTTAAGMQVRIAPNPATDFVFINFDAPGLNQVTVQFFNRDGLLVIQQAGVRNGGSVAITLLAQGIYFVKVMSPDGKQLTVGEVMKL